MKKKTLSFCLLAFSKLRVLNSTPRANFKVTGAGGQDENIKISRWLMLGGMKQLLLHRDIFLFKSYICLRFSKLTSLKKRAISQPLRALSQFHHSSLTGFIFPMIPIINPHGYMLNSDASLFDLHALGACSDTTQALRSREDKDEKQLLG